MIKTIALAFIIAIATCAPDCNSRKLFCMDNGPCPSGYKRAPTVNPENGCAFCDACVATSYSSTPKDCGEPLCVDRPCPSGSTKQLNVVIPGGCKSCPVCVKQVPDIKAPTDCKPPICPQIHCQLKVQTKDDRGCPGCPRCLELEFGMEDEHEVNEALNTYIDEVLASADQNTKPTCPKLDCPKLDCRSQTIGFDANYCLMCPKCKYHPSEPHYWDLKDKVEMSETWRAPAPCPKLDCPILTCRVQVTGVDSKDCLMCPRCKYPEGTLSRELTDALSDYE